MEKASSKTTTKKSTRSAGAKTNKEMSPVLHEFFVDELKDIYWAEKHLTKALPKMQKAATSKELQEAFATHLEQTKVQIERLEQIFESLGEKAVAKKCEAMEGIVKEGESIIEDTEKGTATRDVGLILAAQKVEHYEIATYGGLHQLAVTMGHDEVAGILEQTLNEEKETDQLLTGIAEEHVNYDANSEG
ncbi:ferritin-like domain-containing protein [Panacibacter sp. DH6]|uniref:Ferritin-like domain-containing protein n=1 Tax=Panacibacter microcysteis TaxID=2793269 RepID=A0A931GUN1_9BACT|nr:ferritin-like domain-containing protein [Panacibacter microcysteis]MBG9376841.1 ferritin-like domain-containing protein [Panacibacter microcysteis]